MEENKIKVYIKIDENNCITDINSSIFLKSTENYIFIDEGFGDKYAHAQGNYLSKPLIDSQGRYNYKYVGNKVIEIAEEDKINEIQMDQAQEQPSEVDILKQQLLQTQATLAELQANILLNQGGIA